MFFTGKCFQSIRDLKTMYTVHICYIHVLTFFILLVLTVSGISICSLVP